MVQAWLKIVNKSWRKDDLLNAIQKILNWDFQWLDVKRLNWEYWFFRCRIGNIRIIFCQRNGKRYVDRVWL